ncbi:MAG: hypothetical protein JO023_14940 [Chloroflexi bacterium]|nr:hypothetical protein [Chloroflexota bacterium]
MLANIGQFWRLTREVDINAVRADFERPVRLDVLGSERALATRFASLLDPTDTVVNLLDRDLAGDIRVGTLADWVSSHRGRTDADAYMLVVGSQLEPEARRAISMITQGEAPVLLVQTDPNPDVVFVGVPQERLLTLGPDLSESQVRDRLVAGLMQMAPDTMLPLARRHPMIRDCVARHLVLDTSRVNAQFAAVSNLPGLIPIVGSVFESVADLLVLTKNQILLVLKLAGLYGRDVRLGHELIMEVGPVVGGAFVWRTAARTLVSFLPPLLGFVPKTLVAFTGTYIVGEMSSYYFRYGQEPPAEFVAQVRRDALRLARGPIERITRKSA